MKKQLVFIHGGEAFASESAYEDYLEGAGIEIEYCEKKRWHYVPALQCALGDDWQVIRPDMPSDENAKYEHWELWFEKYIPFLQDGVVLVGHSLGAMFLARYLSENILPVRPSKLFLLAGEFTPGVHGRAEYFYTHLDNFRQLEESAGKIFLLHSRDDFVVPFENLAMWQKSLPNAETVVFEDKNHFLQEEFSEIVELIKG